MPRTLFAVALVLGLGLVACKARPTSTTSSTSAPTITSATLPSSASSTPAPSAATHDGTKLFEAQKRLVKGKVAATTPLERKIAKELTDLFGDEEDDWSAVVLVKDGKPRNVVLIVQFDDLRSSDKSERKDLLAGLGMIVDEAVGAKANVTIGVKGKLLFGAIATKRASGGGYKKTMGTAVDSKPLEDALEAM